MSVRSKNLILWGIYVLIVIATMWIVTRAIAREGTRFYRGVSPPEQGSGAELLMSKTWRKKSAAPAFPKVTAIVLPTRQITNTLAWEYADLSTVTNFQVYRGFTPGVYTVSNLTGKVLTAPFVWTSRTTNWVVVTALGTNGLESEYSNEIRVPPIYTNFVVVITTANATNLQWRVRADSGSWTKLGATNWSYTNPPTRYWRAMGKTLPSLFIRSWWQ